MRVGDDADHPSPDSVVRAGERGAEGAAVRPEQAREGLVHHDLVRRAGLERAAGAERDTEDVEIVGGHRVEPGLTLGLVGVARAPHCRMQRMAGERRHDGRGRRLAGQGGGDGLQEGPIRGRGVRGPLDRQRHQRAEPEPGILRCGLGEPAAEQRRRDQERDAHGDLHGQERRPEPDRRAVGRLAGQGMSRPSQRRREAADDAGADGESRREEQHAAVDDEVEHARQRRIGTRGHDAGDCRRDAETDWRSRGSKRTKPSVSSWRMTRRRPAPRTSRIAISRRRTAARASCRLPTLAHVRSRTSRTAAASRANSGRCSAASGA